MEGDFSHTENTTRTCVHGGAQRRSGTLNRREQDEAKLDQDWDAREGDTAEGDRQTKTNWDTVGARTRSDGAGAVVKDWTWGKCDDKLVQRLTLFLLTADKGCCEQGMKGRWKLRFWKGVNAFTLGQYYWQWKKTYFIWKQQLLSQQIQPLSLSLPSLLLL